MFHAGKNLKTLHLTSLIFNKILGSNVATMFSLYILIQVVKATLEQLARMRSLSQRRWFMTFPFAFLTGMDALGFIQENVLGKKIRSLQT